MADCDKALALVPTYKKALSRRARVLTELGNFKLALEDITAVIMLDEFKNQADIMFADSVVKNLGEIMLQILFELWILVCYDPSITMSC